MKFTSAILSLGFALSAVATPTIEARGPTVVERDLGTVTGVLSSVQSRLVDLDNAIKAYNGGNNVGALQSASDEVVSTTNAGVTTVNGSGDLNQNDALQLVAPVQSLTTQAQTTVDDLIAKKEQLVAAGAGGQVLSDLNQQLTAANALSRAITSKVPTTLQSTAAGLSAGITAAIQKGIDAFQGTGSSSSSAAASSATSSASSAASSASSVASSASSASASSSAAATSAASSSAAATSAAATTGAATSAANSSVPTMTNAASIKSFSAPAGIIAAVAAILAF